MRLIDADVLIKDVDGDLTDSIAEGRAIEKIMNAPTVDAVPVVRCKDCKNWETIIKDKAEYGMCTAWTGLLHTTERNGFCYKGERKEE